MVVFRLINQVLSLILVLPLVAIIGYMPIFCKCYMSMAKTITVIAGVGKENVRSSVLTMSNLCRSAIKHISADSKRFASIRTGISKILMSMFGKCITIIGFVAKLIKRSMAMA